MVGSVGKRYAKALVELAVEGNELEKVVADVASFKGMLAENEDLAMLYHDKLGSAEERMAITEALVEKLGLSKTTANFFKLLTEKGRIEVLDNIDLHITKMSDRLADRVRVSVSSAKKLEEKDLEKISEKVKLITGRGSVVVEEKVDPGLIAGIVTQLGDYVLDGSLRTQLENIKETIKKG